MARVGLQSGDWFAISESPEFCVIVQLSTGFVSHRGHPLVMIKDAYWEPVTDHEGAAAALRLYEEHPPTVTIPLYDPFPGVPVD